MRWQFGFVGLENFAGILVADVHEFAHFLVDRMSRAVGHLLVPRDAAAKKDLAVVLAVRERAEPVGQAPLRHHVARDLGRPLDVVGRARGHIRRPEDQLLGDTSAEQALHLAHEPLLGVAVAVFLGQEHRHAERPTARNDRDLVDRVVIGHEQPGRSRDPTRGRR